jgi:uncharacterized protein YjaZ
MKKFTSIQSKDDELIEKFKKKKNIMKEVIEDDKSKDDESQQKVINLKKFADQIFK